MTTKQDAMEAAALEYQNHEGCRIETARLCSQTVIAAYLAAMEDRMVIDFEAEKAGRYIEQVFTGYLNDPADSEFQRGYLAALLTLYREGLGKGVGDDRLLILNRQAYGVETLR